MNAWHFQVAALTGLGGPTRCMGVRNGKLRNDCKLFTEARPPYTGGPPDPIQYPRPVCAGLQELLFYRPWVASPPRRGTSGSGAPRVGLPQ